MRIPWVLAFVAVVAFGPSALADGVAPAALSRAEIRALPVPEPETVVPCAAPCAAPCAPCPAPCDPCQRCSTPCPKWTISIGSWIYGMDGHFADDGRTIDVNTDWTEAFDALDLLEFALDMRVRLQ